MTGLFAPDLRVRGGGTVEVQLDPREAYLADHDVGTGSLLSTVMSIEALASAFGQLHPDLRVGAVEDVVVGPPLFVREPLVATAVIRGVGDRFAAALSSAAGPHLAAVVVPGPQPQRTLLPPPAAPADPAVSADDVYGLFFHGPAFRVVGCARWSGDVMVGELSQGRTPLRAGVHRTAIAPLLVELAMQTAGLWQLAALGQMAIPLSIDAVVRRTDLEVGADGGGLAAVVRPSRDARGLRFDADVVDAEGRVHVEVRGYRSTAMAGDVDPVAASAVRAALPGVPAI